MQEIFSTRYTPVYKDSLFPDVLKVVFLRKQKLLVRFVTDKTQNLRYQLVIAFIWYS